jgi:mannose-6-phosphate isomerase
LPAAVLYPFTFVPRFKERVWGGRNLERLFGKPLPPGQQVGESWEISDRPGDESIIANGPLAGRSLHWLMERHAAELLGQAGPRHGRFPLLVKLLDAREKLSLQVHPPPRRAAELHGEPKTEMWFIADAAPGAELYVGLRRGVTRAGFEQKLREGTVADCFHRLPVKTGDAMFLPSGRVHAIGAGLVIFEVQQNSDTTYRVFDWNRPGLDGKPRELHLAESLASIDFADFEPGLVVPRVTTAGRLAVHELVHDPLFTVELWRPEEATALPVRQAGFRIIGAVTGKVAVLGAEPGTAVELSAGGFCLIPACLETVELRVQPGGDFLSITGGASA